MVNVMPDWRAKPQGFQEVVRCTHHCAAWHQLSRPFTFNNVQSANRQFIDLYCAEMCLLDRQTADREAANRQRTNGDSTDRCRA
jgi:hypothetical protein